AHVVEAFQGCRLLRLGVDGGIDRVAVEHEAARHHMRASIGGHRAEVTDARLGHASARRGVVHGPPTLGDHWDVTGGKEDGLWGRERRLLTTGLVMTVTLTAAEALAVITVLPLVKHDLGGIRYYGWATSAFF